MKPVILLGSGGHARVLISLLQLLSVNIIGIVDPNRSKGSFYFGISVLGDDNAILNYASTEIELVNGIGSLPTDSGLRRRLFLLCIQQGYQFTTLIHPRAIVADDVELASGVQIMAGAIVQTGAKIACNSIVNSGAIIEHDSQIGQHVHIAPGAVLCGQVNVAEQVHIGAGACVIQGLNIGAGSVIGAGCVVTRNIDERQIVYPAKPFIRHLD